MSLMAGVFALEPGVRPEEETIAAIRAELSRKGDALDVFSDDRLFVAKLDIGAFRVPGFVADRGVAAVTGEPFLDPQPGRAGDRQADVAAMADRFRQGDVDVLKECQGSFSFLHYDPAQATLRVCTDRGGVRPVYYSVGPRFVYFSSNLRVLEALAAVPKRMDLRAVTESVIFAFPLGDRTPYADVKALRGGKILRCGDGGVSIDSWFDWRDLEPTELSKEEHLDRAYEIWLAAVECRAARDPVALTFLSGGLDSRVVAAGLQVLGKKTHSLTFEYAGRQDGPLARKVADALGTRHTTIRPPKMIRQRLLKATALDHIRYPDGEEPRFPSLFFSGDGGSCGLGYIYITEKISALMRDGKVDEVIEHFLSRTSLPERIIRSDVRDRLREVGAQGMREELAYAGSHDPARDFHIFLMENDQRRHLYYLFEDLDAYRLEFLLPFWDGRFLEHLAAAPVDWFLRHAYYYDWLERFPASTLQVPWQAYPGHLPCPIEMTNGLRTQWNPTRAEKFRSSDALFRECRRSLLTGDFPAPILYRSRMLLATLLHGMRLKDCSHLWSAYAQFQEYFAKSRREVVMPK